jgi:hypothetical protein
VEDVDKGNVIRNGGGPGLGLGFQGGSFWRDKQTAGPSTSLRFGRDDKGNYGGNTQAVACLRR